MWVWRVCNVVCNGNVQAEIVPTCRELGIGIVAYSPLGRGFFTGRDTAQLEAHDFRHYIPRFQGEEYQQVLAAIMLVCPASGKSNAMHHILNWSQFVCGAHHIITGLVRRS